MTSCWLSFLETSRQLIADIMKIRTLFLSLFTTILLQNTLSIYEESISPHGTLVAPQVVVSAAVPNVIPKTVKIKGHNYGVKHYFDHKTVGIRLLFLDYPVLTVRPVPIYHSLPQKIAKEYLVFPSSLNSIKDNLLFGKGEFGASKLVANTVDLGEYYSFLEDKTHDQKELNQISQLGAIYLSSEAQLGCGVFAFDQKKLNNIKGLVGVAGYLDDQSYFLEGKKHIVYLDKHISNWIQSKIAQFLLGSGSFKAVPGYRATALPITTALSARPVTHPVTTNEPPSGPTTTGPVSVPVYHPGGSKFNKKAIDTYIREIATIVEKEAFAFGADFSGAEKKIRDYQYLLNFVKTEDDFHNVMSQVLEIAFGKLSHFYTKRGGGRGRDDFIAPFPPHLTLGRGLGEELSVKYHQVGNRKIPRLIIPSFSGGKYMQISGQVMLNKTFGYGLLQNLPLQSLTYRQIKYCHSPQYKYIVIAIDIVLH